MGKSRQQQESIARESLRDILQSICTGIQAGVLERLVSQAKFGVVKNGSKHGGHYIHFAVLVEVGWNNLSASMSRRWMSALELWDLAEARHYLLSLSSAEVVRTLHVHRPGRLPGQARPVQQVGAGMPTTRCQEEQREAVRSAPVVPRTTGMSHAQWQWCTDRRQRRPSGWDQHPTRPVEQPPTVDKQLFSAPG